MMDPVLLTSMVKLSVLVMENGHDVIVQVSLNTGCSISVSPCSPNPCLSDGSCTVDIYGEAVCTCNGEWTGCDCSSTV
jgi:hypothetical protein